mgnify:FL=1
MIYARVKININLGCYDKYLTLKTDEQHPENVHPGEH